MNPLSSSFSVCLAGGPSRTAPAPKAAQEFLVEVAQDGFQGSVVQGIAVDKDVIQAQPVVVEAQPEVLQAQPDPQKQSPCLLTPPEPAHDDGWYFS